MDVKARFLFGLQKPERALLAAAQACFDRFNQGPEKILSVIGSNAAKVA